MEKWEYSKGYSNNRINNLLAKCFRCGYEWIPRIEQIKTCAKCRSPYWDQAKIKEDFKKMRIWAIGIVQNAKYRGFLGKPTELKCIDCGSNADLWEHRSYARPLIVDPVCVKCNFKRGGTINFPRCKRRL